MILIDFLSSLCEQAFRKAFPFAIFSEISVAVSTKEIFGHYQCNDAMKLSKQLRLTPRTIAETVVKFLPEEYFQDISIEGPGFINLTLSKTFLSQQLKNLLNNLKPGSLIDRKEKVIIEFSSPNIAKEMHVGHLRSTVIGNSLAKIFEFLGHEVIRLNHIGDWGTSFGMLITYLQDKNLEDTSDLSDLTLLYKKAKQEFDDNEDFKKRSRNTVVLLQEQEPHIINLWKTICSISRQNFNEIYDLLDISLEERGESFYNPLLPNIVEDLKAKKLAVLSEGAWCVFHEGISSPLMVQKQDGGYNYDTTDMAAMYDRVFLDRAERIIIVTDAGQSLHFELIEKTAKKAGYLKNTRFDHVPFGLVLDANNKKFKTRSGDTVKLSYLLTTAIEKAKTILFDHDSSLSEKELNEKAKVLGLNAIKYADLSCHRTGDYVFSFDKMLRFEGNTATFILYSYVRIFGLQRFLNLSQEKLEAMYKKEEIIIDHPSEIALAVHLLKFPEIILKASEELMPHYISNYLYTLAETFNAFFRDCRVEGSEYQNSRILLSFLTENIFAKGTDLLGLQLVNKL